MSDAPWMSTATLEEQVVDHIARAQSLADIQAVWSVLLGGIVAAMEAAAEDKFGEHGPAVVFFIAHRTLEDFSGCLLNAAERRCVEAAQGSPPPTMRQVAKRLLSTSVMRVCAGIARSSAKEVQVAFEKFEANLARVHKEGAS